MPLTRETEMNYSEDSDLVRERIQEETDRGMEGEGEGGGGRRGDGWEERLIRTGGTDGEGELRMDTIREAEEEEREEESEGEDEVDGGEKEKREGREGNRRGGGIWEDTHPPEITVTPPLHHHPEEDDLRASHNSLDLSQEDMSPKEHENENDDQHLVYATISDSHRAKKRMRMMKRIQKEELRMRKEKRRQEEREEKERRRMAARERKMQERERKKEVKESKKRQDLGLGNVMRLQDVDTSTRQGRAQAQFIDAATAAIF